MHLKTSLIIFSAALTAGAAEFVVTNFTGSLHEAATYENNAVPGVDDVIVWTNAAMHTLESPLAVKGFRENLASMYDDVKISGEPLTLGESGVVQGDIKAGSLTVAGTVTGNGHLQRRGCVLQKIGAVVLQMSALLLAGSHPGTAGRKNLAEPLINGTVLTTLVRFSYPLDALLDEDGKNAIL